MWPHLGKVIVRLPSYSRVMKPVESMQKVESDMQET